MSQRFEINGKAATSGDLAFAAQVNYGHFTSLQVRGRSARGFGLHLDRLERSTLALFGLPLDRERVREWTRRMLDDAPASLRITVFSRAFDRAHPERPMPPDVLVATRAGREPPTTPLRVRTIVHERVLPEFKHVGAFDQLHHLRQARLAGYDDVVFTTPRGSISEGSTWNIGFWDGNAIVWPDAPALPGITVQLLDAGLAQRGVARVRRDVQVRDLGELQAAFAMNSAAASRPITCIDRHSFALDAELVRLLDACHESHAWEPI